MSRFFYTRDGEEVQGPLDVEDIRKMVQAGILHSTTRVCAEDTEVWYPVSVIALPTTHVPAAILAAPVVAPQRIASHKPVRVAPDVQKPSGISVLTFAGCIVLLLGVSMGGYFHLQSIEQENRKIEQTTQLLRAKSDPTAIQVDATMTQNKPVVGKVQAIVIGENTYSIGMVLALVAVIIGLSCLIASLARTL